MTKVPAEFEEPLTKLFRALEVRGVENATIRESLSETGIQVSKTSFYCNQCASMDGNPIVSTDKASGRAALLDENQKTS